MYGTPEVGKRYLVWHRRKHLVVDVVVARPPDGCVRSVSCSGEFSTIYDVRNVATGRTIKGKWPQSFIRRITDLAGNP